MDGQLKVRIDLKDQANKSFDQAGEELDKGNYKNAAGYAAKSALQGIGAGAAGLIVTPVTDAYKDGKNLTGINLMKKSYEDEARKELSIYNFKEKAKQSFVEAQDKWNNNNKTAAAFSALQSVGQHIKHILPFTSPYNDEQKSAIKDRAEEMYQQKKSERPVSQKTIDFVGRDNKTNPNSSSTQNNAEHPATDNQKKDNFELIAALKNQINNNKNKPSN